MKSSTKKAVRVIHADKTGFCFGVKRAVTMAEAVLKDAPGPIYSLGSIIHNEQVVKRLSEKGLRVISSIDQIKGGVIIISSHGISPRIARDIKKSGIRIVDTTCPFVRKAQDIAAKLNNEGYIVIIVGDANHPEVKSLYDFAERRALVVKDAVEAEALKLPRLDKVSILSQTTQSTESFIQVVGMIAKKGPNELRIYNTICQDAEVRQIDASSLAKDVDMMLVVGGRSSANTRRLYEVCRKILPATHLIETQSELKKEWFSRKGSVGITSGASTPDWVIKNVAQKISKI